MFKMFKSLKPNLLLKGAVIVHVWNSDDLLNKNGRKALGHASLEIPGKAYISWWPESERIRKFYLPDIIYTAHPNKQQTFENDVSLEYDRQPDKSIEITCLDEEAIIQYSTQVLLLENIGQNVEGPMQYWHSLEQNCSTIVARALKAGGGDSFADVLKSLNIVWTPKKVEEYAESIKRNEPKE